MADGLLVSTIVEGAGSAILLYDPKIAFPGLSPYGISASRQFSASLATFALITYYAHEDKTNSTLRVVAARAGVVYHTFSAAITAYNFFTNVPFFGYDPLYSPTTNAVIAAIGATTHLAIAGLLYQEGIHGRKTSLI